MTQERETEATAGEAASTGDAVETSGAQTVEEVEAFWRNRTSGIQRAHNAETADLKAQMEALRKSPANTAPPEGESAEAQRVRALETELQQEKAARQAIELQAKYPRASEVLGDAIVRLADTPEKLAAIEAFYEDGAGPGGTPRMDPNAARRSAPGTPGAMTTQKPLNEKSKDELLADLARTAPAFQQAQREGLLP